MIALPPMATKAVLRNLQRIETLHSAPAITRAARVCHEPASSPFSLYLHHKHGVWWQMERDGDNVRAAVMEGV